MHPGRPRDVLSFVGTLVPELPETIRTERLTLRRFRLTDLEDVLAYATDPQWARYLPVPHPYTRRDGEEFLARRQLADWSRNPTWAIELDGRVVGGAGLHDPDNRQAGLGYSIARDRWGQGLATEAARAVVVAAFRTLDLDRVFATADARNLASQRVMEKLGMRREALLRQHRRHRGEFIDEVHRGILREEWERSR